jgi:hypothetical protein
MADGVIAEAYADSLAIRPAPRLRPANVPIGPFPGLRPPASVRIAGDIPDVCAFYREECPPSLRVAYAGSALVATRCARPPFGCAFRLERTPREGPAEPPQEGGAVR